jgi:FtsH-binding integral membrane protein
LQLFQQLSGINVIVLYGGELAEGFLPSLKTYLPMLLNGEKLIVSIVGAFLLVRFGRREMMLSGLFILVVTCVGLFIGFQFHEESSSWSNILIMTCFFLYIISFVMTLGPIVWLYIA